VTFAQPIRLCLLAAFLGGVSLLQAENLAERVVILANSRQPESVRLAEFYAAQRAVPPANIIALPLPEAENITWREFIDQVYQPLQDELLRRGWLTGTAGSRLDRLGRRRYALTGNRIAYLVVCRGVPLRIFNDPTLIEAEPGRNIPDGLNKNEAAVDAELCMLGQSGYEITGMVPNPLFAYDGPPTLDAEMVVKVSRLDGPTFESARRLVTSALAAEAHGLLGRYYVDLGGPDKAGDRWLETTQAQLQELGFDGDTERTGANFDAAVRFDAPVFYFGWYAENLNGPFAVDGFTFPPGAVAIHIHSYSAQTLHSDTQGWCGPLVARGVTATVGNVFEPYLGYTHWPYLLLRALSQGRTFGDAVYYALPKLSWQEVAIGDPLYRPFKVTLADQERAAGGLPPALAPYAVIRRANLLLREGKRNEAIAGVKDALLHQPSLPLGLYLARMELADHDPKSAVSALKFVSLLHQFRPEEWPLVREIAGVLAANDAGPAALQVYLVLLMTKAPTLEAHKALLMEARKAADTAGDLQLSLDFARQLNELAVPPPVEPAH
jgi:uncharacterized protein (TIGR03790 family)